MMRLGDLAETAAIKLTDLATFEYWSQRVLSSAKAEAPELAPSELLAVGWLALCCELGVQMDGLAGELGPQLTGKSEGAIVEMLEAAIRARLDGLQRTTVDPANGQLRRAAEGG
jgi:hypothetical protein